jgi:hypothetical protein
MLEKEMNTLRRETRVSTKFNRYGENYYQFDISDEHSIFVDYQKQRQHQGSSPSF